MPRKHTPKRVLTHHEKAQIRLLVGQGLGRREAAQIIGCSESRIATVLCECGGFKQAPRVRSSKHLTLTDREEISRGLARGDSLRQIARLLGRPASTISREVRRNGGNSNYRATTADNAAWRRAKRPKPSKLSRSMRLRDEVEGLLVKRWSPQQIARRLRAKHPDDTTMQVSHETIYKSLFVQSRGEFRRELTRYLRSKRTRRKPTGKSKVDGRIKDMVMISERPAEAEDRAVPGHWEGDLLMGSRGSAIVTLVERHTRYVLLGSIGKDKTTESVTKVIEKKIQALPENLKRSLTWDQGKEMSGHARFTIDSGVQVYFCDPKSPWQRGTNENTNRLLRDYFPKGTDLSQHSQRHLDDVAAELNERIRMTLDWVSPASRLDELLR